MSNGTERVFLIEWKFWLICILNGQKTILNTLYICDMHWNWNWRWYLFETIQLIRICGKIRSWVGSGTESGIGVFCCIPSLIWASCGNSQICIYTGECLQSIASRWLSRLFNQYQFDQPVQVAYSSLTTNKFSIEKLIMDLLFPQPWYYFPNGLG